MSDAIPAEAFLRVADVAKLTTLNRATVYEMAKAGTFPHPRRLGERGTVWLLTEVVTWMQQQPTANLAAARRPGHRGTGSNGGTQNGTASNIARKTAA